LPIITNETDLNTIDAQLETLVSQKREVSAGLSFFQESIDLGKGRFTNLYWVELDKARFKFKFSATTIPIPLINFHLSDKKSVAGINFGSFFLSDDFVSPVVPFYNLLINEGQIWQLPSNGRPALITGNGRLQEIYVPANGSLKIGGRSFLWSGSKEKFTSEITVFGMFDLTVIKLSSANQETRRRLLSETKYVNCHPGQLLIGIQLSDGKAVIEKISNEPIDLTQYAYVFRGKESDLKWCENGQTVEEFESNGRVYDKNENVCSASFSLGNTREELVENLKQQLVYPKNGQPKPLFKDYLKSWSVILETKESVIFFVNDARPKVKNQNGISAFELQEILIKKFDYLWACVGDSGQSSKLMVGDKVYGNMHYQNYSGRKPFWDGINGRSIPIALLAYEQ